MKTKVYLRIAKGGRAGFRVDAKTTPDNTPIMIDQYRKEFAPTVAFAVEFEIPDELFKQAERVIAQIDVAKKESQITGEMLLPKIAELKKEMKGKK